MIPEEWRDGEVAVVGLGRSGAAATRFLVANGLQVYVSDNSASEAVRTMAVALAGPGVTVDVGRHDLDRISRSSLVVTSPGVPPQAPPLRAARSAGREIIAELDLAAMQLDDARLIVVTGTNGKTTTTKLIAHLLCEAGESAEAAGNIGVPLIELTGRPVRPDWIAVEASSFQLHDSPHLTPTIGVMTNLAPDHLDRYESVEAYYADKRNLFRKATIEAVWVLNGDDPASLRLADGVIGKHLHWSLQHHADAWYDRSIGQLVLDGQVLLPRAELALLGDHNVANALAAAIAVRAAGIGIADISRGLRCFRPLPHRLEPVREVNGTTWINDSKATNTSSTLVAVTAMDRPFVLIAGGRAKGGGFDQLVDSLAAKCRAVVAYGEARGAIEQDLSRVVRVQGVASFYEAVSLAKESALKGDVVLLSPACASFDQFSSYEERGDVFRRIVESL